MDPPSDGEVNMEVVKDKNISPHFKNVIESLQKDL